MKDTSNKKRMPRLTDIDLLQMQIAVLETKLKKAREEGNRIAMGNQGKLILVALHSGIAASWLQTLSPILGGIWMVVASLTIGIVVLVNVVG